MPLCVHIVFILFDNHQKQWWQFTIASCFCVCAFYVVRGQRSLAYCVCVSSLFELHHFSLKPYCIQRKKTVLFGKHK